jgi:uncharacterized delta-60 repeat protein
MHRLTRRSWLVPSLVCALVAIPAGSALAAAGDLDTSFGGDGKVTTNFTSGDDTGFAVGIQADGKIVAAGTAAFREFALARYNADGTLDTTFGGDGKVTTNLTSGADGALSVAIQADGKIVSAGAAGGTGGRFALARYNIDGTLDTGFSSDGKLTTNFTSGPDVAFGVAIQGDGKIVAAGTAGFRQFAVARYDADGTLDSTFGGDGKVTTDFTSGDDFGGALVLQADEKAVVAGRAGGRGGRFGLPGTTQTAPWTPHSGATGRSPPTSPPAMTKRPA